MVGLLASLGEGLGFRKLSVSAIHHSGTPQALEGLKVSGSKASAPTHMRLRACDDPCEAASASRPRMTPSAFKQYRTLANVPTY